MLAPEDELRFARVPETRVGPISREPHNALRLRVRERAQEHGVDDCEDRRVSADAQRKRDDGDQCESWLLHQHSRAVSQVLNQSLHNSSERRGQMSVVVSLKLSHESYLRPTA